MNSLSVTRIYYLFRDFTSNSSSFWQIHYEYTIDFANSLWIHYLIPEINIKLLSSSRFLFEFILFFEFSICFANSPWIHDPFQTTMILIWNHYEITMKSLCIHYLLHVFTKNSSSFSRMHYLFREFFMISLSASWFFFEFTIFSRIHF